VPAIAIFMVSPLSEEIIPFIIHFFLAFSHEESNENRKAFTLMQENMRI
jgi:hypothetical protein